tara:strand:- start:473 stop:937 length:465 start_codon:yes stop_codon:yes gene_type:complete
MAKKFPDLTGDGKVTQADILKGRGVKLQSGGQATTSGGRNKPRPGRSFGPELPKKKPNKRSREYQSVSSRAERLKGRNAPMAYHLESDKKGELTLFKTPKRSGRGHDRPKNPTVYPRHSIDNRKPEDRPGTTAVKKFQNGGAAIIKTNQKPHMS